MFDTQFPESTAHIDVPPGDKVVLFSDAHYRPGLEPSSAYFALLDVIIDEKPSVVIDNGDSMDLPGISRHPRTTWDSEPTLLEEMQEAQYRHNAIELAAHGATLYRNIGNHDLRFESKLVEKVPEYAGLHFTRVSDYFPKWAHHYSVTINKSMIVLHKWKGGLHAAYNNAKGAGISIATGHTHRLVSREVRCYSGSAWGVECGTLANLDGPQFRYTADTPLDWHPGFVILHVHEQGIYPELIRVFKDRYLKDGKWYEI